MDTKRDAELNKDGEGCIAVTTSQILVPHQPMRMVRNKIILALLLSQ